MSKICYIFGAGEIDDIVFEPKDGDYVIAADGGLNWLESRSLTADMAVGDFDSLGRPAEHPNIVRHPPEKDETDMLLAVNEGIRLGYRTFVIFGALGGRLDHTLANIQTIAYLSENGCAGYLVGGGAVITAVKDGALRLKARERGYVSVFCHGSPARGVGISGLKFELNGAALLPTMPIGVSNEFIGKDSIISVDEGILLVLWYEDDFSVQKGGERYEPA